MNAGKQSVEWLYHDQLEVDDQWAIRTPNGFKWWADKHAQTVEVIGQENGPGGAGDTGYWISVRTEFLRDLDMTDRALGMVNDILMSFAAMSGPVYDAKRRTLDLCSLVNVHDTIGAWMNPLISVAAVLQLGEASFWASELANALGAKEATSGHPNYGMRPYPDEMAQVLATVITPLGKHPGRWSVKEFQDAVDKYMQQPPSLLASAGGQGCTVEFPYGDGDSSLCQMKGDRPLTFYGNGLSLRQSFPVGGLSDAEGIRLALSLNATELAEKPSGYGFGSYLYAGGLVHFAGFLPNAAYRSGLLPNLYFASAGRARAMSLRLMNRDWDPASFNPRRSAMGRMLDRLSGR